jgi:hypothetical protein
MAKKKLLTMLDYYDKNTSKKDGSKKGSKKEETKEKDKDGSKKDSKKKDGSKKDGSKKKDGKKGSKKADKVYCGPKKTIPKSYDRLGTMLECAQKRGGIALWGVNRVDSKILKLVNGDDDDKKSNDDLIKEIKLKQVGYQGKLTKLRKEYNSSKDEKIKENIKKEFEKVKNEIIKLQENIEKLKK